MQAFFQPLKLASTTFIFFFMLTFCQNATAQQHSELGAWLGTATYFGDLNPDYNFANTRPALGVLYRYTLNDYMALKATASATWVEHSDASSRNPYQQARNLNFRTNILEVAGFIDLHFQKFVMGNSKYHFTPYLTAGLAIFHFNPKTKYEEEWYNLNEIGTEGQQNTDYSGRKPYKRIQPAIPIGFGLKNWIRGKWTCHIEATYRSTFTDYLDDVSSTYVSTALLGDGSLATQLADRSGEVGNRIGDAGQQRGDIVGNDGYLMLNVGITYVLFNKKCPRSY